MTPPPLAAIDLYRFYHVADTETAALRGVSLSVERGEILAVIGPSGSSKSSLLCCLAGLDDPDGGQVLVFGSPTSRQSEHTRARLRNRYIGLMFQQEPVDAPDRGPEPRGRPCRRRQAASTLEQQPEDRVSADWHTLDGQIDTVLTTLRAPSPNQADSTASLDALLTTLNTFDGQ